MEILLPTQEDTRAFAQKLAKNVPNPFVIYLQGELGAGKTTFAQYFLRALGVTDNIPSPTFTLMERYTPPTGQIYHMDLYRLNSDEELEYLGIRDIVTNSILLIEWPTKGGMYTPTADISLHFTIEASGRALKVCSHSKLGEAIRACL